MSPGVSVQLLSLKQKSYGQSSVQTTPCPSPPECTRPAIRALTTGSGRQLGSLQPPWKGTKPKVLVCLTQLYLSNGSLQKLHLPSAISFTFFSLSNLHCLPFLHMTHSQEYQGLQKSAAWGHRVWCLSSALMTFERPVLIKIAVIPDKSAIAYTFQKDRLASNQTGKHNCGIGFAVKTTGPALRS